MRVKLDYDVYNVSSAGHVLYLQGRTRALACIRLRACACIHVCAGVSQADRTADWQVYLRSCLYISLLRVLIFLVNDATSYNKNVVM